MASIAELEARRQVEQGRLDRLKGVRERNRLGQFATPEPLAVAIAGLARRSWAGRGGPIRFLDPARGQRRVLLGPAPGVPRGGDRIRPGDRDRPGGCQGRGAIWGPAGLRVVEADFTRMAPPESPDTNLMLVNPPYARHHHLDAAEKRRIKDLIRRRLGLNVSGLSGLHALFLLLADAWLAEGGLAVWIIPSEFMDVNYGEAVKRYLTERVTLRRVHRFAPEDVQFGDALVTSAVVAFEKTPPGDDHRVEFTYGGDLGTPSAVERVSLKELAAERKWTAHPRSAASTDRGDGPILGDLFTIRRGIATGANDYFILPRREAGRLGLPDEFLRPILPSPREVAGSWIEADGHGFPALPDPLVLLDCDRPEAEVRQRFPSLWAYLEAGRERGLHRRYLASRRNPWYAQERRDPAPFLSTYMGRRRNGSVPIRFVWNQSAAIAPNVWLLLYPSGPLKAALVANPGIYPVVLERLRSIHVDRLVDEGRVYGGGLHKMEPRELANLPAGAILDAIGSPAGPHPRQLALF